MVPTEGQTIDVLFSCGAASAVALMLTLKKYGNLCDVKAFNNPIKQEDSDNIRFLRDVESWLGVKINFITHPKYPDGDCEAVWDDESYMSGVAGAPCTRKLKRQARQIHERERLADWLVLGFTAEERLRHKGFVLTERDNVLPILIDAGLTKQDCFDLIGDAGLQLPRMYRLGFPNANCVGCVKAQSATYWNHVRHHFPDVFASRAEQSRRIGARLVVYKGVRLFLDELPISAMSRPMKELVMPECSIFCEERPFDRPAYDNRDLI